MTTTYTLITKASGTSYTIKNGAFIGYDDPTIIYDSSSVSYDGLFNQTPDYTLVTKASGTSYTLITKAT